MLAYLALLWLCSAAPSLGAVNDPPPLGRMIDVGGYRVHLNCTGTGNPAVVVLGSGFSFDWALVQPEVARFTRVCTYDPSGSAWSEQYPPATTNSPAMPFNCSQRVAEIHHLLDRAEVPGPYIVVGFSMGALVARVYAQRVPEQVAGIVLVDHALLAPGPDVRQPTNRQSDNSAPVLIYAPPINLDFSDDQNFRKLPAEAQKLHAWARARNSTPATLESAAECSSALDQRVGAASLPLGNKPLIVVRTANQEPAYNRLIDNLLQLSHNSRLVLASHSSHMVILDEPEVVVDAIHQVVTAVSHRSGPN